MTDAFADPPRSDQTVRRPLPSEGRIPAPVERFADLPRPVIAATGRSQPDFLQPLALPADPFADHGPQADFNRPGVNSPLFAPSHSMSGFEQAGFDQAAEPSSFAPLGAGDVRYGFSQQTAPPRFRSDPAIDKAFDLAAINPLVSAASPLLWLAGRLGESAAPTDIVEFRQRIMDEIRQFETSAMARDTPERLVRVARYALCALIDDIILNTRWGAASGWASRSLVASLYNETWGGERFYDLLAQMMMQPETNIEVIELMAIALAIGFVGKYRVMDGGMGHLNRLRHDVYRTIRRVRGPYERKLAAEWPAVPVAHRAPVKMTIPWAVILLLIALIGVLWAFASISLRSNVETIANEIRTLVPAIPVVVEKAGIPVIPDPVPPIKKSQIERIREALSSDLATSLVEVEPLGEEVVIRLVGVSFPSGGVEIAKSEDPRLARIAAALDPESGKITVIGHTDNVPVGPNSPLGDNMAISLARAKSAAAMLQKHLADPQRVEFEGRGQNESIADNSTDEGRARNRRVEFRLPAEKSP